MLSLDELNAILGLELGSIRLQNMCLEEEREKEKEGKKGGKERDKKTGMRM